MRIHSSCASALPLGLTVFAWTARQRAAHQDRLRERPFEAGATCGGQLPLRCQLLRQPDGRGSPEDEWWRRPRAVRVPSRRHAVLRGSLFGPDGDRDGVDPFTRSKRPPDARISAHRGLAARNRPGGGRASAPARRTGQIRRSAAVFLQGDLNITEKLIFTLGARYTEDRAHYDQAYANLFIGGVGTAHTPLATTVPCAGLPGTCAYDPAARFDLRGSNDAPTGRAALSYSFENGMLGYISFNRGYRSGAINGGGYTSSSGITYIKPETVNAYEAGLKGRLLDKSLTFAAAAFYYDYSNQQLQDTRPGPVSFLVNAPKSKIYGAESEATWHVVPTLTLRGAFGYLHATYSELSLQNTNLAGNTLPFAPTWTAQAGFDWTFAEVGGGALTLSPKINYVSRQFFSPFNDTNAAGTGQENSELEQGAKENRPAFTRDPANFVIAPQSSQYLDQIYISLIAQMQNRFIRECGSHFFRHSSGREN